MSRLYVYKGFAESAEFNDLCKKYGIQRGNVPLSEPMDQNEGVTRFVVRCYRLCLNRDADKDGLNYWCSNILSHTKTAKETAWGFIFSSEFLGKNVSDADYIRILYRTFLDRESDPIGLQTWLDELASGQSREHVFNGFADSSEFRKICNSYGIQ